MRSYNPELPRKVVRFGLFRFRSPLLTESLLFSLPPGTEMVHFPGFAPPTYEFSRRRRTFASAGFPHSEILGSWLAYSSPRLIAVGRVLHRLLSPRHPPCALSSLTIKFTRNIRSRVNLRRAWCHRTVFASRSSRFARLDDPAICLCALQYSLVKEQGVCRRRTPNSIARWWAWVDLNHRPHPYQGCALTN